MNRDPHSNYTRHMTDDTARLTVSLPTEEMLSRLQPVEGVKFIVWDMESTAPDGIAMAVVPYMTPASLLSSLDGAGISVVQSQSIGFDGVEAVLPTGTTFCNAAGVHEASTAELAVALTLASLRGLPDFVTAQAEGLWVHAQYDSLADKRIVIIGHGGIGQAAAARFRPFETIVDRVATTARTDEHGPIHALDELPELLPHADVVVLAVPLTETTKHLVDAAFLAAMKRLALLVNVSRGPIVDTDALLASLRAGHVRAALDVTDPEPLPTDHPLWSAPGVLISPHVGGHSGAMAPRVDRLIRSQATRLAEGGELVNVVLRT